jgi:hypothetical protein
VLEGETLRHFALRESDSRSSGAASHLVKVSEGSTYHLQHESIVFEAISPFVFHNHFLHFRKHLAWLSCRHAVTSHRTSSTKQDTIVGDGAQSG